MRSLYGSPGPGQGLSARPSSPGRNGFEQESPGRVVGTLRGRAVLLKARGPASGGHGQFGAGDEGGSGPSRSQTLSVEVHGAPEGVSIDAKDRLFGVDISLSGSTGRPFRTGDVRFDGLAEVHGDHDAALAYLTDARREALVEMLETPGLRLRGRQLTHWRSGRSHQERELQETLERLESLARRLDEAEAES